VQTQLVLPVRYWYQRLVLPEPQPSYHHNRSHNLYAHSSYSLQVPVPPSWLMQNESCL
jgi:hypothetical protein